MNRLTKSPSSAVWRGVQRLVRRLSEWALRELNKANAEVSDRRAHAQETATDANGGSLH